MYEDHYQDPEELYVRKLPARFRAPERRQSALVLYKEIRRGRTFPVPHSNLIRDATHNREWPLAPTTAGWSDDARGGPSRFSLKKNIPVRSMLTSYDLLFMASSLLNACAGMFELESSGKTLPSESVESMVDTSLLQRPKLCLISRSTRIGAHNTPSPTRQSWCWRRAREDRDERTCPRPGQRRTPFW